MATRPKLLMVSFLPVWDMEGGGTAARHRTLVGLARRGFDVTYLYIHVPSISQEMPVNRSEDLGQDRSPRLASTLNGRCKLCLE